MKKLLLPLLLIACGESQPEPLYLTEEFYEWVCHDYQDRSEIIVETSTCEDHETGLYWLIAETHMVDGSRLKRKMDKAENWHIDCLYQTRLPLAEEYCIEVEGVTLTAYVEPASWSGALFGD